VLKKKQADKKKRKELIDKNDKLAGNVVVGSITPDYKWRRSESRAIDVPGVRPHIAYEPDGTPLPETPYEKYLEARIQHLEKELNDRHWVLEGMLDKYASENRSSRRYSSHSWE
jgi:hypothetical protein